MKKYRLTSESIKVGVTTLYRIEALTDFGDVKQGDKGGFVESYYNLAQTGNCWIYDNAKVMGEAYISENAKVTNESEIRNTTMIYGDAQVAYSYIWGDSMIYGNSIICDANMHDVSFGRGLLAPNGTFRKI